MWWVVREWPRNTDSVLVTILKKNLLSVCWVGTFWSSYWITFSGILDTARITDIIFFFRKKNGAIVVEILYFWISMARTVTRQHELNYRWYWLGFYLFLPIVEVSWTKMCKLPKWCWGLKCAYFSQCWAVGQKGAS